MKNVIIHSLRQFVNTKEHFSHSCLKKVFRNDQNPAASLNLYQDKESVLESTIFFTHLVNTQNVLYKFNG